MLTTQARVAIQALMSAATQARVAIHQVEGYVWCDAHGEVHERRANPYEEDETGRELSERCIGENWRPVFTTDSVLVDAEVGKHYKVETPTFDVDEGLLPQRFVATFEWGGV